MTTNKIHTCIFLDLTIVVVLLLSQALLSRCVALLIWNFYHCFFFIYLYASSFAFVSFLCVHCTICTHTRIHMKYRSPTHLQKKPQSNIIHSVSSNTCHLPLATCHSPNFLDLNFMNLKVEY